MTYSKLVEENKELCVQIDHLALEVNKLSEEREAFRNLYLSMLEKCRKLELGLMGQKAERLSPNDSQLTMDILNSLLSEQEEGGEANSAIAQTVDDPSPKAAQKKHPGRRPLPSNLPRVDIEIVPDDVKEEGLAAFEKIGEEVTETLERRSASLIVVRSIRPTFVRKDREKNAETNVLRAELPDLPIERGMAGPGLLASTLVSRWQDHMPLHRLESMYRREGIDLHRKTIGGWHMKLAQLCTPLYEAMWADAKNAPYLCTDATGVLVQAKKKCEHSHFWIVLAPDKHALFHYSKKHNSEVTGDILGDYQGYLVADAHSVYNHLYENGDIVECGCWAHLRRYFHKSLGSDPERARFALALIKGIFQIEADIKGFDQSTKKRLRNERSLPLVDRFFAWCDQEAPLALEGTPIAAAIGYAQNQQGAFMRFLEDGRLPIHNNGSERQLRRQAVGRKNWLFVGSDDGGITNAIFVSLLASAQMHGLDPQAYLRDILCLLPSWPVSRVLELAPVYFKHTLQQPETKRLLEENIFRQAVLKIDHQLDSS